MQHAYSFFVVSQQTDVFFHITNKKTLTNKYQVPYLWFCNSVTDKFSLICDHTSDRSRQTRPHIFSNWIAFSY